MYISTRRRQRGARHKCAREGPSFHFPMQSLFRLLKRCKYFISSFGILKGADVNAKQEESGQTALMAAVLRGKTNIVSYLLKAGADPMIGEGSGYHPPHGAAFQGRPEIMQILIDSGLDVNSFHDDGYLPLHRVCWGQEKRHADTLVVLLKHGVDPEVKSKDGKTCREMTKNKFILDVLDSWNADEKEL